MGPPIGTCWYGRSGAENFELHQRFFKNSDISECDDVDLERVWEEVLVA